MNTVKDGLNNLKRNKMTSVEWLDYELAKIGSASVTAHSELFEQAKEMEKQQIIDAYKSGRADVINKNNINPIQYYNETFKDK